MSQKSSRADHSAIVDPKTIIDGDTFDISVRVLDIDAPRRGKRANASGNVNWPKGRGGAAEATLARARHDRHSRR